MRTRNLEKLAIMALTMAFLVGVGTLAASADEGYVVEYRLTKWKDMHFTDAKKAEAHFKTLKSLGCEVKQGAHGDHVDVTYRCMTWKHMTIKNHDSAHKWENWLKASGFETKHEH